MALSSKFLSFNTATGWTAPQIYVYRCKECAAAIYTTTTGNALVCNCGALLNPPKTPEPTSNEWGEIAP